MNQSCQNYIFINQIITRLHFVKILRRKQVLEYDIAFNQKHYIKAIINQIWHTFLNKNGNQLNKKIKSLAITIHSNAYAYMQIVKIRYK